MFAVTLLAVYCRNRFCNYVFNIQYKINITEHNLYYKPVSLMHQNAINFDCLTNSRCQCVMHIVTTVERMHGLGHSVHPPVIHPSIGHSAVHELMAVRVWSFHAVCFRSHLLRPRHARGLYEYDVID